MKMQKLTKKQIAEALDQTPMNQLLNVERSKLTSKQIAFCENLARGETKAGSYRKAYNSKAKTNVVATRGHEMAKRGDIQDMTEAIRQGLEFQKAYTAGQIRALVVQRLTQEAISEDSNPSVRVNALKALGTIAGVDAFVHRSETTVIKDSDKARAELMDMLKQSMADNQRTIVQDDSDILELLNEINPATPKQNDAGELSDPHAPLTEVGVPDGEVHSNPHIGTPSELIENNLEENQ